MLLKIKLKMIYKETISINQMSNPTYQVKSQRQQILTRPGQHIGSIKNLKKHVWLYENDKIIQKEILYNSGLIHIFYEILSNAQDNYFRSLNTDTPCKRIKIDVEEDGWISVWNDGLWIPTRVHEYGHGETKIDEKEHYEAELIFGYLNSSSNYNDNQNERIGAGLHGHGAKLTNIFSKEFRVETFDPQEQKRFYQEYKENMTIRSIPKIKSLKSKTGYTKISYLADFSKFGLENYSQDLKNVIYKLCLDCAMITGVQVFYNNEKITSRDLSSYTDYYYDEKDEKIEFKTKDSNVILRPAIEHHEQHHIAFVNGILTPKGGIHVNAWTDSILKPLSDLIRKKFVKNSNLTNRFTKGNLTNYFVLFVKCNLKNPDFETQTKQVLVHPKPTVDVPETKIKKIIKWKFIQEIEDLINSLNNKDLQKNDGAKKKTVHIENAKDAIKAGGPLSDKCSLFLTEGLSAKSFAIKGIDCLPKGQDFYGAMAIRGKLLNVRTASINQLKENKEISNLKKMLGLQHGLDYTKDENFKKLRYGKLIILTDQDNDGNHIKGLIINLFDKLYPTLLKSKFKFICGFKTPIVRVSLSSNENKDFYDMPSFKKWYQRHQDTSQDKIKYFKGLGTWKDKDIVKLFQYPVYIKYLEDDTSQNMVDIMFNDKKVKDRKQLLENYEYKDYVYEKEEQENNVYEKVPITDFIQYEFLEYSMYDNKRSIPHVLDGLKPSQRKTLYYSLHHLSTEEEKKVERFGNSIAEHTAYHHGEDSLKKTIVKMAQSFVGSNNIPYFKEEGQFGTRLEGGEDYASPRYIFVKLQDIMRKIFRKEDDCILSLMEDEGAKIEPECFYPIIPMAMVNGTNGIGTGYSSKLPSYNPIQLVNAIRCWLDNKPFDEFIPWYRGYKGDIDLEKNKITYTGKVHQIAENKWQITELPIKTWTEPYQKKVLNDLIEKKVIQNFIDNNSAYSVSITVNTNKFKDEKDALKKLKLQTTETIGNLPFFNKENKIQEFHTVQNVFEYFCKHRYHAYSVRKTYYLEYLKEQLGYKKAIYFLVCKVLDDTKVLKQTEEELIKLFETNKLPKKNDKYNYLLNIPIRQFTKKKKQQLEKEIQDITDEYKKTKNTTEKDMWINDLNEFVKEYKSYIQNIENMYKDMENLKNNTKKKKKTTRGISKKDKKA